MNNNINTLEETNDKDCKTNCKKLCVNIPLFVKTVVLISIILCALNYFFPSISFYLSNAPFYTINKYQIWRLFTTTLIKTNIINIILAILFWIKHSSNLEDVMGTIKYLFIFIMNSTIIQILFTCILFIISLITKKNDLLKAKINSKGKIDNSGIWPYIICELTLLSLSNPNYYVKFLFFPEFKAKFYPILVLILFCILNTLIIDLEVLSGIIYALLYHFLIKKKLKISNNFVRKLENSKFIKCFILFGGFVSVNKNKYSPTTNKQRMRNVVVSHKNNIKGFTPFQGERNIAGDSLRETSTDINSPLPSQKSQNETLDVKIE
jgi:hypothetical protein